MSSFHQPTSTPLSPVQRSHSRPTISLSLLPCTLSDVPAIKKIYFATFTDPVARTVFPPDSEKVQEWWSSALTDELHDEGSRFLKVVAHDSAEPDGEGVVVAFGKWNVPNDDDDLEAKVTDLPEWPVAGEENVKRVANEFFGGLARGRVRVLGAEKAKGHWYLEMLGTLPEYQGLGAAGMIIRWGLEQTDSADRISYLESSPKAVAVYDRYGFEYRDRVDVTVREGVQYYNVFMIRYPRKESQW